MSNPPPRSGSRSSRITARWVTSNIGTSFAKTVLPRLSVISSDMCVSRALLITRGHKVASSALSTASHPNDTLRRQTTSFLLAPCSSLHRFLILPMAIVNMERLTSMTLGGLLAERVHATAWVRCILKIPTLVYMALQFIGPIEDNLVREIFAGASRSSRELRLGEIQTLALSVSTRTLTHIRLLPSSHFDPTSITRVCMPPRTTPIVDFVNVLTSLQEITVGRIPDCYSGEGGMFIKEWRQLVRTVVVWLPDPSTVRVVMMLFKGLSTPTKKMFETKTHSPIIKSRPSSTAPHVIQPEFLEVALGIAPLVSDYKLNDSTSCIDSVEVTRRVSPIQAKCCGLGDSHYCHQIDWAVETRYTRKESLDYVPAQ
ncbi:hypothetical protein C8R45DRAFT_1077259 [Mycena sanguinolenta]|nr:hypothetical protein C8R45DRAFT_1077259 [Mycena sanguinolenta]